MACRRIRELALVHLRPRRWRCSSRDGGMRRVYQRGRICRLGGFCWLMCMVGVGSWSWRPLLGSCSGCRTGKEGQVQRDRWLTFLTWRIWLFLRFPTLIKLYKSTHCFCHISVCVLWLAVGTENPGENRVVSRVKITSSSKFIHQH